MEEIRVAAKARYYENTVFNRTIQAINRRMDIQFDNEVNYENFVTLVEEKSRRCTSRALFQQLDRGRKGHLDQDDVRVLYYLMDTRGNCSHCGDILWGVYYTCLCCFDDCTSPNKPTFNVCATCYCAKAFNHPQHNDFLDNYELLQKRRFQQRKWGALLTSAAKGNVPRFLGEAIGEGWKERAAIEEQLQGLTEMAGEQLNQAVEAVGPFEDSDQVTTTEAGDGVFDILRDMIDNFSSMFS